MRDNRGCDFLRLIVDAHTLQKYHGGRSAVNKKDGLVLVREMAAEVKNMMDFKMNAVMVRTMINFRTNTHTLANVKYPYGR